MEDRRGMRMGGGMALGGGGLGIAGVVIYVLIRLLGGNVSVDDTSGGGAAAPAASPQVPNNQELGGSCEGVTSTSNPAKFISCVVSNVQRFWARTLPREGQKYEPAHMVLFTDATPSGCGSATAATGPFYCPLDGKVYLDVGFFRELERRFHARGGDFAQAYVVAHEYGHHIQALLGIERKVRMAQRQDRETRNAMSVKLELQADCLAGVWGHSAYEKGTVSKSEVAQALDAAAAVGDDRIQKEVQGRVNPESFTHGSSAERQRWFETGMSSGDLRACDTFGR
ncbi:MAG: YpfJ protein zinc metalloprotease superfamily protein [Myxococcales bacterium]|nr:YpfJ protein zinc metalloprotease superfamily protein [Myxococcales bacterium]